MTIAKNLIGTHWGFKWIWILTKDFKFWIKSNSILTRSSLKSHDTKINYLLLILIISCGKFLKHSERPIK